MKALEQIKIPLDIIQEGIDGFAALAYTQGITLRIIASWGGGWEHVSVNGPNRCPTWEEMCFVKDLFWKPNEWVIQYHPASTDYINLNNNVLHLWKPTNQVIPKPPKIFV